MSNFMHGSKARVFFNGNDVSTYLQSVTLPATLDSAETSVFGNTYKTYVPGLRNATANLTGIFDGSTTGIDEIFDAALALTTDNVLTWCPQGDVQGGSALGIAGIITNYQPQSAVSDVSKITATMQSDVGSDRGLIYAPLAAYVAGNGASIDGLAPSTNGGVLYVQIISATGLTVTIQDSADNTTFADIATTVSTSTPGAQRIVYAGSVRQYTRIMTAGSGTYQAIFARK